MMRAHRSGGFAAGCMMHSEDKNWMGDGDLGRFSGSKTLVPSHFGDDRAEPDQVFLALRAWMLHRWQQNGGAFLRIPCRQRAWQLEFLDLRADIARRGGVAALRPKTLDCIRTRAPDVVA